MDLSEQSYLEAVGGANSPRAYIAHNYRHLHRRLLQHLGCADLATTGLHTAWLRLGAHACGRAVVNMEAYVYRVACNAAIDVLRGERSGQHVCEDELEHIFDPAPGPEDMVAINNELQRVEEALMRLPHRQRAVLIALRVQERSRDEVAQWLGVSLRSVDTALRNALARLARVV